MVSMYDVCRISDSFADLVPSATLIIIRVSCFVMLLSLQVRELVHILGKRNFGVTGTIRVGHVCFNTSKVV